MTLATKAALFSAFVFPGSGYFIVNKKLFANVIMLCTFVVLYIMMTEAVYKAQIIAQNLLENPQNFSIEFIKQQIAEIPGKYDPALINGLSWGLGFAWVFSIIDCYRIGKKQTKQRHSYE